MLGAIAGDIIGSVYEAAPVKTTEFPLFSPASRFTDDTVMSVALADALLRDAPYAACMRRWGRRYPDAGYGRAFHAWLMDEAAGPYQSWGNGAAMRVSPVGFACASEAALLEQAARSAAVSHDHPEGIRAAQAIALSIFLARHGEDKGAIRRRITAGFGYNLRRTLAQIRPHYRFDVSCQGSVPESLIAFFESQDYESAVRNAVSLGGDSDTMACIAGGVAQAYYGGVPEWIRAEVWRRLPADMRAVVAAFERRYAAQ